MNLRFEFDHVYIGKRANGDPYVSIALKTKIDAFGKSIDQKIELKWGDLAPEVQERLKALHDDLVRHFEEEATRS